MPENAIIINEAGEKILLGEAANAPESTLIRGVKIKGGHRGDFGQHDRCKGMIRMGQISDTHCAIDCQLCNLRVTVPTSASTLTGLRKHFAALNQ